MGTNPTGCTEWERDYDPITEQPMTQKAKFEIGQSVYKWTGDYNGPGVVRGIAALPDGKLRYLVGHTIQGGKGEFLHVYAAGNLRAIDNDSKTNECPSCHEQYTDGQTCRAVGGRGGCPMGGDF